ncbi:unnamed protein product [Victoria cruziana]
MEEPLEMVQSKDTKERMAGVERLHGYLENCRRSLSSGEITSLVDCCLDLLKDSNFRVSQGALQSLASAAILAGEHLKLHFNALVPAVVERLGDAKQPVRDAARRLLLTLMEVSSPTIIVERAGSYAWTHKSWRIREEFVRTVSSAVGLFASTELTLQRVVLPQVLQLLNDSNNSVREAATLCIEQMYTHVGPQFCDELQRHHLPPSMVKEIGARLEKIEPKVRPADTLSSQIGLPEIKPATLPSFTQKKNSPKIKSSVRESSLFGGENDVTEKSIEPVKVFSEKELIREIEKIAATLVPEQDWSVRISAMQRLEGLVLGGAADYASFLSLLKQLIGPLSGQLSDRRSSIVKQACHLLNFLSKELLGDFEACAEMFIPVLFKLVVITVLVIAESADNCIKTMLRNCKVARVLPRIADCAKNDRSAVLRARCCEYALLILEYWADASEIQRSADLYEDLIKCCVADAMSEVRSTARTCYRMFSKTWPERSRRLFLSFDPVVQRIINEEDGGIHRRYASPTLRERGVQPVRGLTQPSQSNVPGFGTSSIVAMDRSTNLSSGVSLLSGSQLLAQTKTVGRSTERSLESVLQASKQQVTAIESMLKGLDISERHNLAKRSTSLDLGVDPPSSRDPPFPLAVPASSHLSAQNSALASSTATKITKGNMSTDFLSRTHIAKRVPLSSDRPQERFEDIADIKSNRRFSSMQVDRQYLDAPYKDPAYGDVHGGYIPNFQRPLLRKPASGRVLSGRNSHDEGHLQFGEMSSCLDGPVALSEALTEGLSPSSNWSARVSAFRCVHGLLQQGPKGIQEVTQNFEKIIKLFFQHLDDPHHKVAQAAFTTLTDMIPVFKKPFESYLERILPHVFSRLIDQKELVRQASSSTLEMVGSIYGIESLLPAFLRSLDEQRSPKAKIAVIEFAINSFNAHAMSSDSANCSGLLKLWLAKLAPLVNEKNSKLKETAITSIISVYTHFDSAAVLNFIVGLSVEEQNSMRRALKRYTPRIEVDLMNFLQNKKERSRSKSLYDQLDVVGTSSEEGYVGTSKKNNFFGRFSAGAIDSDGGRKWSSMHESMFMGSSYSHASSDELQENYQNHEGVSKSEFLCNTSGRASKAVDTLENKESWNHQLDPKNVDHQTDIESCGVSPSLEVHRHQGEDVIHGGEPVAIAVNQDEAVVLKGAPLLDSGPSIPQLLHQICNGNDENLSKRKKEAIQQLVQVSMEKDPSVWTKYFNQILTALLEVVDDGDPSVRELALSLILEMLNYQKDSMEDSIEIVIEKLLHASRDSVAKVSNEAERCLTIVLSQYEPYRCLSVITPLLISEDEKALVSCINCLTKLVGRLSQEELMGQLPSFLPALFDAFGNQSADVRKTVVFCLVDIYIVLGKAFLPYLGGLSSTQLRLVTIYANRISQARSGTPINGNQG